MRYATAAAFRQALDDRLKAEAAKTGLARGEAMIHDELMNLAGAVEGTTQSTR